MGYDTIESSIDLPARMAGKDTRASNNSPVDGSMQDGEVLSLKVKMTYTQEGQNKKIKNGQVPLEITRIHIVYLP